MMKSIQSIFIALGILVSVSVQGGERGLIEVNNHSLSGQSIISVINTGFNYNSVKLVCNLTGESFIQESIENTANFQKLVDLKTLNDGDYTVELEGNGEFVQKKINIQYGELRNADLAKDIFEETKNMKFFLDDKKEKLTVSYINPDKDELTIKLVNLDTNKVVDHIKGSSNIAYSNIIELDHLRKGNYRTTLISGDTSYHFDFTR
ncbi:hypothetical protein KEM09_16390 [Carboxylicivirga mesophila]|uniref:Secretion system C-terminal sorting domain-containing protein n=1 Tax=Carboxylicivirga mesophila TaxID=1166478 RepID=A0ABS5KDA6_9BACT|nr:hypothetical protein [Carboxylicivirga mesophila]MBS2212998.1 hypothetical protein [Carboxylicivirga mesophila]